MWPLLSSLVAESIVVPLSEIAVAMKLIAERCHVIAGAAALPVAAAQWSGFLAASSQSCQAKYRPLNVRAIGERV